MVTDEEWQTLITAVREIQEWFPEGVAFIGGIAIYAHCMDQRDTAVFAAKSHDADFMILTSDFQDLRDIEVLTPNRRLGKQQFVKAGIEFDVYPENQHNLAVPVDEAIAHSEIRHGIRVVCTEHLLILKLYAQKDRKGTSKGNKDEDDIFKTLLVSRDFNQERASRVTSEMVDDIEAIVGGDAAVRIANGNLHHAKILRDRAEMRLRILRDMVNRNYIP